MFTSTGTFSQLYYRRNLGSRNAVSAALGEPADGSFTYKKIDDRTAALSFINSSFAHPGFLQFDSAAADTGVFFDPSVDPNVLPNGPVQVTRRTFRLVPLATRAPMSNCSNRSFVRAGGSSYAGFVIAGTAWRMVLIRAVGPGLAQFGIADHPRDPVLGVVGGQNDDWGSVGAASVRRLSAAIGAFALPEGSKDSVVLINAPPGAWVAQASAKDGNDSGQVLIEVYVLP